MSHTITPTDAGNITSITVPSDGDLESAASVEVGFQGAANLAAYCRALLFGSRNGSGITSLLNGQWVGASFINPTLSGTITTNAPILGNGTNLLLGQSGGESLHILNDVSTVAGTLSIGGLLSIQASAQFTGTITPSGIAYIRKRPIVVGATTNHSYAAANPGGGTTSADIVLADPTAGSITYTLDNTGAQPGDEVVISVVGASNTTNHINIVDHAALAIAGASPLQNTGGTIKWARLVFFGGTGQYVCVQSG